MSSQLSLLGSNSRQALIATFLSIGVLITGVVLLSLKSSAKTAGDPYTVTTESNSIHLRPRQPRQRSGGAEAYGDVENGAEGSGARGGSGLKGGKRDDGLGEDGHGDGAEEVMWEVGSLSDSDDDERKKPLGPGRRGDSHDDELRRDDEDGQVEARKNGASQPGGRGERRGLLGGGDDADAEEEVRVIAGRI